MGVPQYTLRPNLSRMLVPQSFILLGLCAIFYGLLVINLSFILDELKTEYLLLAIAFIGVIFILGLIMYYIKDSHLRYNFYNDRIENVSKDNKVILYNAVVDISHNRNFMDKLFNTCTIALKPDFEIKFINDNNNVYFYIQKLVERSRNLNAVR